MHQANAKYYHISTHTERCPKTQFACLGITCLCEANLLPRSTCSREHPIEITNPITQMHPPLLNQFVGAGPSSPASAVRLLLALPPNPTEQKPPTLTQTRSCEGVQVWASPPAGRHGNNNSCSTSRHLCSSPAGALPEPASRGHNAQALARPSTGARQPSSPGSFARAQLGVARPFPPPLCLAAYASSPSPQPRPLHVAMGTK